MKKFKNIPLQWWLRLCISLTFFFGGAFMVFWAQGFRFDFEDKIIVSTGALSVSTSPEKANVFLNSELVGRSPHISLGLPLRFLHFCLQKSSFLPYCDSISLSEKNVRKIQNIFLLPVSLTPRKWGDVSNIMWDPLNRGFIWIFPELASTLIMDNSDLSFVEKEISSEIYLDNRGNLVSPLVFQKHIFSSDARQKYMNSFLPNDSGFLYTDKENKSLFLKSPSKNTLFHIDVFSEKIESYFFLPESESFLVSTVSDIYFFSRPSVKKKSIFKKDSHSSLRFFPDSKTLFWEYEKKLLSYSFR